MKFCTNCGQKLSENVKFCTGCGEKVNEAELKKETPNPIKKKPVKAEYKNFKEAQEER